MKKALLCGSIQIALAASALAQGTVVFEDSALASEPFGPAGTMLPFPVTFALMWAPGTAPVPDSQLVQLGSYGPTTNPYFTLSSVLVTGNATANGSPAIFEVQAWTGNFANQAAALAGGAQYVWESYDFVNGTGNPNPPATPPVQTTGWDGNLHLVPEPSTLALGASGGLLLWAKYRRRKRA